MLKHFNLHNSVRKKQINHFFDTALYIIKINRMILRLRDERDQFTMTVKDGAPYQNNLEDETDPNDKIQSPLVVRLEIEFRVPCEIGVDLLAGKICPFKYFQAQRNELPPDAWETHDYLVQRLNSFLNPEELKYLGSYTNYRISSHLKLGTTPILLELDETHFPNGEIHHEVEVELAKDSDAQLALDYFEGSFKELDIEHFPDRGKSSRFYDIAIQG